MCIIQCITNKKKVLHKKIKLLVIDNKPKFLDNFLKFFLRHRNIKLNNSLIRFMRVKQVKFIICSSNVNTFKYKLIIIIVEKKSKVFY